MVMNHIMKSFNMDQDPGRCFVKLLMYGKNKGLFPPHKDIPKDVHYIRYVLSVGQQVK